MFDFENLNDAARLSEAAETFECMNDMVDDTHIAGFEQVENLSSNEIADYLRDHVPGDHLRGCPEIRYAPESVFFREHPDAAGVFYADTKRIEIASEEKFGTVSDMMDAVLDGVGRNVYSQMESIDSQASRRWEEIFQESGEGRADFVTDSSKNSPMDDFAESYRTYIGDPELLKLTSPGKYEFMKNLVFFGREYETIATEGGQQISMEKGVASVLNDAMENNGDEDDLIRISDGLSPISDTYRCFTMVD